MVVGNKNKRGRKKEKEGRGFGRLPSFFFPPFLFVFLTVCFLVLCWGVVILVPIWLCFEDSSGFEPLKYLNICVSEIVSGALKNTAKFEKLMKNTVVMSPIVN